MSKPINYICTKCSFSGSSYSTWGKHSYLVDNELIPTKRNTALCYTCNSIVSAEILPKDESIQMPSTYNEHSKQKFDEEKRIAALRNRKSSARCLACGSHNFELIPHLEPNKEQTRSNLPIRTGLFHRNCGGRIYAEYRTPNFFMSDKLPERYYDIEGIKI